MYCGWVGGRGEAGCEEGGVDAGCDQFLELGSGGEGECGEERLVGEIVGAVVLRKEGRGECKECELAQFDGLWFAQFRKIRCTEILGVRAPREEFEEGEIAFVFGGGVIGAESLYLSELEKFGEDVCAWGGGGSGDDVGQKAR